MLNIPHEIVRLAAQLVLKMLRLAKRLLVVAVDLCLCVIATWLAGILSQARGVPDLWPRAGNPDRAVCGPGHSSVWAPRAVPVDFPPLGVTCSIYNRPGDGGLWVGLCNHGDGGRYRRHPPDDWTDPAADLRGLHRAGVTGWCYGGESRAFCLGCAGVNI